MADYLQSLRLTAVEDTTISLNTVGSPNSIQLEYRTGYGSSIETDWSNFDIDTEYYIGTNYWLELRGQNTNFSTDAYSYYRFTTTGQIDVSGELYSLIDYYVQTSDNDDYTGCFAGLFRSCQVRNAKDLVLPYKQTSAYAYAYMFANCQNLRSLPQIDGYGYAHYGYAYMFYEVNAYGLTLVINRTDMQDQNEMFDWFVSPYGGQGGTTLITNQNVDIPTSVIPDNWLRQYVDDSQHDYLTLSDMVIDAALAKIHCNSEDNLPQTLHFWARPETSQGLMPWRRVFPGRQLMTNSEKSDGITKIQLKGECLCAPDDYDADRYDLLEQWSNSEVSMETWSRIVSGKLAEFVDWRNPLADDYANLLASLCIYRSFFSNNILEDCSGLVLPAIVSYYSPNNMFDSMFFYCSRLTQAPELPSTDLVSSCYADMFFGCSSLTTAPELPATNLAIRCYEGMFKNCSALTQAPELPATSLADYCYNDMFNGCSNLNKMVYSSNVFNSSMSLNWLGGVSQTGTFYYTDNTLDVSKIARSANGVPASWSIQYLAPKPKLVFSINGKAVSSLMIDGKAVAKLG